MFISPDNRPQEYWEQHMTQDEFFKYKIVGDVVNKRIAPERAIIMLGLKKRKLLEDLLQEYTGKGAIAFAKTAFRKHMTFEEYELQRSVVELYKNYTRSSARKFQSKLIEIMGISKSEAWITKTLNSWCIYTPQQRSNSSYRIKLELALAMCKDPDERDRIQYGLSLFKVHNGKIDDTFTKEE